MLKRHIFILSLLLTVCGSLAHAQEVPDSIDNWVDPRDTVRALPTERLIEYWRRDSLGCLRIRSVPLLQEIIHRLLPKGTSKDSVLTVLGPPNHVATYGTFWDDPVGYLHWNYFFSSVCDPLHMKIAGDRCRFDFMFSNEDHSTISVQDWCQ